MKRLLAQLGEIEMLARNIIFADHFEKLERTTMPCSFAGTQRAERFADGSAFVASGYGDEDTRRVVAKRGRKADLLLGSDASRGKIRRTEALHKLHREQLDNQTTILFIRFDDLRQR